MAVPPSNNQTFSSDSKQNLSKNVANSYIDEHVQICQKSQRIGCVIPRCKLQCGITQPILRLFLHICNTPSIARQASLCLNRSYSFEKVRRERPRTSYSHHILNTQPNYLLRSSTSCTWIHVSGLERGNRDSWIPCSRGGKRDCRSSCKLVEFCG